MLTHGSDLYTELGLAMDASSWELGAALQSRLGAARTQEEATFWQNAAATLLDPGQRAIYDRLLTAPPAAVHSGLSPLRLESRPDYYTQLGLPGDAPPTLLAVAINQKLANADDGDERIFWLQAHTVLLSPRARASYNRLIGAPDVSDAIPPEPASGPPVPSIWSDVRWLAGLFVFPVILVPGLWVFWELSRDVYPSLQRFAQWMVALNGNPMAQTILSDGLFWLLFLFPSVLFAILLWALWSALRP